MKFLKAAVVLLATMTLLPFLTHADSMGNTNSSLPYCNGTDDNPVTTTDDVCLALYEALNDIDDLCVKGDIVSWLPQTLCMYGTSNFL